LPVVGKTTLTLNVSGIWDCRAIVRGRVEEEMAHSLAEIEDDALRLPPEDRARLAVDLLASLEESVESPEEIEKLWLAEAERRFRELRDGVVKGIPARDVFAQLRAKLRS
jgi:putative addiction module component (TIGR02574 family)